MHGLSIANGSLDLPGEEAARPGEDAPQNQFAGETAAGVVDPLEQAKLAHLCQLAVGAECVDLTEEKRRIVAMNLLIQCPDALTEVLVRIRTLASRIAML